MGDIVSLQQRRAERRLIWVCNCGCTTLYHYADGAVECASCEAVADSLTGEWRERLPAEPEEAKPVDGFRVIDVSSAESFLRRQIAKAKDDLVRAVVVIFDDGGSSTFTSEVDTPARRTWLGRQMRKARRQMLPVGRKDA